MKTAPTAYDKGIALLARRAHSRGQLRRKLQRLYAAAPVEEALDRLQGRGFLDDEAYARARAASSRRRRLWGDQRIRADLLRAAVDKSLIERTLIELEENSSQRQALTEVVRRWVGVHGRPAARQGLKKLFDRCLRLGYPPAAVRDELSPYFDFDES